MATWRSADARQQSVTADEASSDDHRREPAVGASLRGGRFQHPASRDTGASLRGGFTLIEVLVALAIVSIALLAALRAAGQGTSNVEALRARLLAGWVAENVLAEQRARGDWPAPGIGRGTQRQAGMEFTWREEVVTTPNDRFRRVDLHVFAAPDEEHQLSHLTGFVVDPPAARP